MFGLSKRRLAPIAIGVTCAIFGSPSSGRTVSVEFSSSNFADPLSIDNVYFPLVQGTTQIYKAETKEGCETVVTTVTSDTRVIDGVTTRVVHDTAYEGDSCTTAPSALVEDTLDYYAQDDAGNVWYFGEDSYDCAIGTCPRNEGSWIAGADPANALPGIIMLANPASGDTYYQEQAPEVALDQATVTSTGVKVTLKREDAYPPGSFTDCIKTKEFSDLEKGSTEFKYYCPNVGNVLVEEHHGALLVSELTGGADPLQFRTVPKQ
jgi:hypothetical protein